MPLIEFPDNEPVKSHDHRPGASYLRGEPQFIRAMAAEVEEAWREFIRAVDDFGPSADYTRQVGELAARREENYHETYRRYWADPAGFEMRQDEQSALDEQEMLRRGVG